ncbi:hypothetical protein [Vulcanisaeta distributa]|uniref:hypothetical protein n=1 Tax=Vulcanisaeta distributa TaxID=164451 RepID=UPI000ACE5E18|nr:hypothetical protein [Vulcanisaeta distributa]
MSDDTVDRLSLLIKGVDAIMTGFILYLVVFIFYAFSVIALMGILIHLPPISMDMINALVPILLLVTYATLVRRGFDLMVKAYPKDYDVGKVGVFIVIFASLLSLAMDVMVVIRVSPLIINLVSVVVAIENFIGQFMIMTALYRLGYYSNTLKYSSVIMMISYVLVYLGLTIVLLRNYLIAGGLFITGVFILVPSYGSVIYGLNNAHRTITNLIIELSKPGSSKLFNGRI